MTPQPNYPPHSHVRFEEDLVYATLGERQLLLDLYWHTDAEAPTPLIIWVHGGAWLQGNKGHAEVKWALNLLPHGYAVTSIGYRLSQEALFPAQIMDSRAAVLWLRTNARQYNVDPERFSVWGPSAGGHLVALLGTAWHVAQWDALGEHPGVSSRVQAVCDWYGPSDFLRMNDVAGLMDHDAPDSPESRLIGGPIQENKDLVAAANPITYVTPDTPPFLIMHGADDLTVPLNQSELLHAALRHAGVASTLTVIAGAAHGFGHARARSDQILPDVIGFFDRHLK